MITSIYLSMSSSTSDWIIGMIAKNIKDELAIIGVSCKIGNHDGYQDQDICFHMSYAYAKPIKSASHNSVFITHIDDRLKEKLIKNTLNEFDSIICMSEDDAKYIISLGFSSEKVFGLSLPVRSSMIKPLKLGIFSSLYLDGRKNEKWLIDYFNHNSFIRNIVLVFIGENWGDFSKKLADMNMSFEWHRTSSDMPYEYQFQQNKLDDLDYYFYLGFDGGAMGTYDAYSRGVKLMVSEGSYHDDIPDIDYKISSYQDFEECLDNILNAHRRKIDFFLSNSIKSYVSKLHLVWSNSYKKHLIIEDKDMILKERRSNHSPISLRRITSFIKQIIWNKSK